MKMPNDFRALLIRGENAGMMTSRDFAKLQEAHRQRCVDNGGRVVFANEDYIERLRTLIRRCRGRR